MSNFICDKKIPKLLEAEFIYKADLSYEIKIYTNKIDNQEWQLSVYRSDMLQKKIYVLEQIPVMTNLSLIDILLTSNKIYEMIGVVLSLYHRHFLASRSEVLKLVETLEKILKTSSEKEGWVKLCVYESGIYDATNREPVINKSLDYVNDSIAFYKSISVRAKILLGKVDSSVSNGS